MWDRPLTLIHAQVGAAKIYLDGERIYTFGKVGTSRTTEQIDFGLDGRPKIRAISFSNQTDHLIAVRYSNFSAATHRWADLPVVGFGMFPMMGFGGEIVGEDLQDGNAHKIRKYTGYHFFFVAAPVAILLLSPAQREPLLRCLYCQLYDLDVRRI